MAEYGADAVAAGQADAARKAAAELRERMKEMIELVERELDGAALARRGLLDDVDGAHNSGAIDICAADPSLFRPSNRSASRVLNFRIHLRGHACAF